MASDIEATEAAGDGAGTVRIRAAQYVRMSTENQKYSTTNQAAAIAQYASKRGMDIVRTYADLGKSGLSIEGRDSLKLLMSDVQEGRADFSVLLVYDISRWGRFQDADEAAFYEYSCTRAGVRVHYCAEQFENDGSLLANLAKSLRRSMAGEFSRDLSVKVFAGQSRLAEMGFKQGGAPGIGLRRLMIDEHRRPKGILTVGQQKNLVTDRVILIPGPEEEIHLVQRIYRLFVVERLAQFEIARVLNDEGIVSDRGVPWTTDTIHRVLISEKYAGHHTFGKVSFKLQKRRVVNAREAWIRCDRAFEPIIDQALFDAAQLVVDERSRKRTNEDYLCLLKQLLERRGRLSANAINTAGWLPMATSYARRFGSVQRAYELIGYAPDEHYTTAVETRRHLNKMRSDTADQSDQGSGNRGGRQQWIRRPAVG